MINVGLILMLQLAKLVLAIVMMNITILVHMAPSQMDQVIHHHLLPMQHIVIHIVQQAVFIINMLVVDRHVAIIIDGIVQLVYQNNLLNK
jgi:hypothetical protein